MLSCDKLNIQGKNRFSQMRILIGDCSNKVVLDIGVGESAISQSLKAKKIITLDGFAKFKPDIVCDLNKSDIPLRKNSVDVIIAGEIIEHVLSPVIFLKKCNRVLKKGGYIVLSTPNITSLKNRIRLIFGKMPEHCCTPTKDGKENFQSHVKDFNLNTLNLILDTSGYELIEKRTNGIIFHSQNIFPLSITPTVFGECLIVKAKKVKDVYAQSKKKSNFRI